MATDGPMVTAACLTFNHVAHVSETLDSMLAQETDFPFEIVVHDDASTDGTREVIKEYAAAYPYVIVPILQEENQYSKGVNVLALLLSAARGKYTALCEGDDYWSDPSKLQRQFDFMRANPDATLCGHATMMVRPDGEVLRILRIRDGDGDVSTVQVLTNHDLMHTSSLYFPSALGRELPKYFYMAPVGDRPLKMHLASAGRVHFLDSVMSHYRYGVAGSWTAGMQNNAVAISHASRTVKYLEEFDSATHREFTTTIAELNASFKKRLLIAEMDQALQDGLYHQVRESRFSEVAGARVRLAARLAPLAPRALRPMMVHFIRTIPSVTSLPRRFRQVVARRGRSVADQT